MSAANGFTSITPRDLHQWMEEGKDIILIDTLPGEHYLKRRLPDSVNACVYEVTFPQQIEAITSDRDREIVVYGSSEKSMDAAVAAEKLLRLGFRRVYALTGGLKAWQAEGFELQGEQPGAEAEVDFRLEFSDRTYTVDPEQSIIEWTGRNPNGKHNGTVRLSKGEISVHNGIIGGTFEIDMRSITNIDLEGDELQPVLIEHLMSDDFFFVRMFPKAIFTIQSARPAKELSLSAPNFEVEGTLELRGVRADIKFPATVTEIAGGAVSAETHFDIDRTRWGVIYGSSRFFEHLGMHLVFDLITIQLRVVAR